MSPRETVPSQRLTRSRSLWRGVRGGRPPTGRPTPEPSSPILDLVATPYTDVWDAHRRLSDLEETFRERGDRRAVFLAIYARVTEGVGRAVEAGEFEDPEWVADYLVTFADYYRRALYAFETGDLASVPDPWQVAFEAAARGDGLVVQDAVLGINAHVNYDLAYSLHEVAIDPARRSRYRDHCAVNDVLWRLVDDVQSIVADSDAPGVAAVDDSLGRLDEVLAYAALAGGRDSAWRSAVRLSDSRFGLRRRLTRWYLRTVSTGTAYLVLGPTVSTRVRDALRDVELGDGDGRGERSAGRESE